jgi:DNA repair protein RecN (Recombination protein N)
LLYGLEDLAANVRAYRDAMEFDAARLDAIEDRLTLIRDMQRKYRGSIEEILERANSAEAEIDRLTHSAEHMADLEARESQLRAEIGVLAGKLSRERRATGDRLAAAVEVAMRDLAMPHVRFYVSMDYSPDPQGVPILDADAGVRDTSDSSGQGQDLESQSVQRYAFDKTGVDKVEFMLSPNPGEPLKPLARIASGGESARLLLALKSILSRVDEVPTLVFDEVDVGVGGRAGQVLGEKLWTISAQHQVICITHLPQVAAFGDTHYTIAKIFSANRTRTTMQRLDDEQRADEIAAMLDGTPISEHSRRSAQEMLQRAQAQKIKGGQEVQQPLLVP